MSAVETEELVKALQGISNSVALLSGISSQLISLNSYAMTDANNSGRIAEVLERLEREHQMERAEDRRMNRDGEWEVEWFVEVPLSRKPIRFDDEESAYDGARRAAATDGIDPETIVVFCTEVKRFKREDVSRAAWESA